MRKELYPYQRAGADFLAHNYHALLADDPGTGKTAQAIAAAEALGLSAVLVICPASVRLNWAQEITECLGSTNGWSILSYNQAATLKFNPIAKFDAIILDEAHFLKTPESKRTQAIFGRDGLARRARYKWCLTGTPVLNRPRELWPIIKSLNPKFADTSFSAYAQRYCGAYFDGYGINTKGATHLDELRGKLEGFMLRRTKAEVLPQLPPKIISRTPLEVSRAEMGAVVTAELEIENREALLSPSHENFAQLGDLAKLLRVTGLAKVRAAAEFIADLLETEEKVVVFARHRDVIKELALELHEKDFGVVTYIGGMNDIEKSYAIRAFKEDRRTQVFIGNIQAAGTGINGLQEVASTVVFAELSWVPGEMGQAIDRTHRIGQTARAVNVHLLHVPGSLESAILSVQGSKEKIIERLMGSPIGGAL